MKQKDDLYDLELQKMFCLCDAKNVSTPSIVKEDASELFNYIITNYNIQRKAGAFRPELLKTHIITSSQYKNYLPAIILAMCGFKLRDPPITDLKDAQSKSPLPKSIGMSFNQFKEVYSQNQGPIDGLFHILVLQRGSIENVKIDSGNSQFLSKLRDYYEADINYDDVQDFFISKFPTENEIAITPYETEGTHTMNIKHNLIYSDKKFKSAFKLDETLGDGNVRSWIKEAKQQSEIDPVDIYELFHSQEKESALLLSKVKAARDKRQAKEFLEVILNPTDSNITSEMLDTMINSSCNKQDSNAGYTIRASMTFEEGTDADMCRYLFIPVVSNNIPLANTILSIYKAPAVFTSRKFSKYINSFHVQLAIKLATQNATLRSRLSCAISSLLSLTGFQVNPSLKDGRNVLLVKNYSEKLLRKNLLGWKFPLSDAIITSIIKLIAEIAISFLVGDDNKKIYNEQGGLDPKYEPYQNLMFVCEFTPLAMNDVLDPVFKKLLATNPETALTDYVQFCEKNNNGNLEFFKGETMRVSSCIEELIKNNIFNNETLRLIDSPYHAKMNQMIEEIGIRAGLNDNPQCFLKDIKDFLLKFKTVSEDHERTAEMISNELLQHWPFLKNQLFTTSNIATGLDPSMSAILEYLKHYCPDKLSEDARTKLFEEIKSFMILQRNCQNFLMLLQMTNKFVQVIRRTSKVSPEELQKNYVEILKIVFEYVEPKLKEMMNKQQDLSERCLRKYRDNLGLSDNDTDFNIENEFTSFIQKVLGVDLASLIPPPDSCPDPSQDKNDSVPTEKIKLSNYLLYF